MCRACLGLLALFSLVFIHNACPPVVFALAVDLLSAETLLILLFALIWHL
jgi:hypothetical protein